MINNDNIKAIEVVQNMKVWSHKSIVKIGVLIHLYAINNKCIHQNINS